MKKFSVALAVALCLTAFVATSCQKFRSSTSRARVNTLLITGNYIKPRLLCELAQYRSRQPIVLVQNDLDNPEDTPRLFYLQGTDKKKSQEIAISAFKDEWLPHINPKVVIFVGNADEDFPADLVRQGKTVSEAMDQVFGQKDIGHGQGAIGYLSRGLLERKALTEQSVTAAMVPRLNDSYDKAD